MRVAALMLVCTSIGCGSASLADLPPEVFAVEPTYATNIAPLFSAYCVACHGNDGERAGGVELDQYASAFAGRVHHTCVSVDPEVVSRFEAVLIPFQRSGQPARQACEGWEIGSMPTGARSRLTLEEQVILARWVETGGPP